MYSSSDMESINTQSIGGPDASSSPTAAPPSSSPEGMGVEAGHGQPPAVDPWDGAGMADTREGNTVVWLGLAVDPKATDEQVWWNRGVHCRCSLCCTSGVFTDAHGKEPVRQHPLRPPTRVIRASQSGGTCK